VYEQAYANASMHLACSVRGWKTDVSAPALLCMLTAGRENE